MLIISSREFRSKLKWYFERADKGQEVVVKRKNKSYKIVPIEKDDSLMTKKDFFKKINDSIQEIKEGKLTSVNGTQELEDFFDSL